MFTSEIIEALKEAKKIGIADDLYIDNFGNIISLHSKDSKLCKNRES